MKKILFFLLITVASATQINASEAALCSAVKNGRLLEILQLLNAGVDVNSHDGKTHTALTQAAYNGHVLTAELLIMRGAEIDGRDPRGGTPLMWATTAQMTQLLLQHKAYVNTSHTEKGNTPLMCAATRLNSDQVKLLLEHKASVNIGNYLHETPLSVARQSYNAGYAPNGTLDTQTIPLLEAAAKQQQKK